MSAKTSTWADMRREHVEIASEQSLPPQDMNHIQRARTAIKNLASYVIFASKRKAVPKDALPTEALVALLAPNYVRKPQTPALQSPDDVALDRATQHITSKHIHFVRGPAWPSNTPEPPLPRRATPSVTPTTGRPDFHDSTYKAPKLLNPHTQHALLTLHTHIERTGQTPLVWHRSQGAAINKHNNKKGQRDHGSSTCLILWGKPSLPKNMPKHNSPTMTLALRHTDAENMPPSAKIAPILNSPVPNATS